MSIWEFIHGYASFAKPESITFFDNHDQVLYRDVSIQIIGQHGWELVSVILSKDPNTGEQRYEYFFKRDRSEGYPAGFGKLRGN